MLQRKTDMKRVGKRNWGEIGEGKKMKMNHLIYGWECWLMVSKGTISGPIICQKMLWLSGQRKLRRKLPAKILEYFPQTSTLFLNLKEYKRRCYSF